MENPKERIEDILKRNPYLDAKVKNSSLQRQKNLFLQAGARMTGR